MKIHLADRNIPDSSTGKGRLFIISAPSGTGKTTLCKALLHRDHDMLYSVSYTTRIKRNGEQEGKDYYFVSTNDFIAGINQNKWAEWSMVHGNYYGTPAKFIETGINAGKNILLDIDVNGAMRILEKYPAGITIFILPPSFDILKKRVKARGSDTSRSIEIRLKNAEIEMKQKNHYQYRIINDDLQTAVEELVSIVQKHCDR